VKLADFSVLKRLEVLQDGCRDIQDGGSRPRNSKAGDIVQVAGLVLGMLNLPADIEHPPTLPKNLPLELRNFLEKCFLPGNIIIRGNFNRKKQSLIRINGRRMVESSRVV